ncbi:hypothetical protein FJT64_001868 [Amphibalanus amphitrite]|uniref:Uncharacterized protein n=1 Tax=Amphibalanus amphitrite TaxID=1232801 RepID=A0A6A4WTS8_AMPAM|nr:hypothetical protein FJT64_001868 [Amphibalanus amphitrite]
MEMTDVREDLAALRREVASLSKVVAGAVVRLEQAVIEERTTRQTVVEDLRQEVRRRAAPSGRPQSEGVAKLRHLKTVQRFTYDVIGQ